MTRPSVLHLSHATNVAPRTQEHRERGLLAAGALGEAHLHVSSLAPSEVLALGAFHRAPSGSEDDTAGAVWRRSTGGRPCPAGNGSVVVTLALPHRSALVDDERTTLAPEQVMNRCMRGILHALRTLGVDVVYPGLDLVTCERRAFGVLSFVEIEDATLFQAVLQVECSLADTAFLVDRLDPEGTVPITLVAPTEAVGLGSIVAPSARQELTPDAFVRHVGAGFTEAFGIELQPVDDEVTEVLADAYTEEALSSPPDPRGRSARANGLLGVVEAWADLETDGAVADLDLTGDFIAPIDAPRRLADAVRGARTGSELEERITSFLDRDRSYVLGLRPAELVDLVQRSATLRS